ncbi:MAG: efflux RND transporter periplasmic adaptor subunit [Hyphomicrobiaceae bacterium]
MKAPIRYLFTLAVPIALAGLGAVWMMDLGRASGSGYAYDTVPIERGGIKRIVSTSGPVRAVVTVSVGSQLSGQIRELGVDFNSEVKSGQVLAVLDDQTFAARVAQARADVAAAHAQLENQQAALTRAEAVKRNAGRVEERQKTLARKGISAQATVDTARRDMETAEAEIAVAKAQIAAAHAAIAQKEAMLKQAEIDLDRTRIRSPIDGTVISRTVDVGQTVAASLQAPELFKIAQDLRRIQIEAQVNEADVGQVKAGNPVTFRVDAYPERQFAGRVGLVRLAATELQNVVTYTVVIEADNEDRVLFPGMTANVAIETARRDDVLKVASEALRFRPRPDAGVVNKAAERDGGNRGERLLAGLVSRLGLDAEQADALKGALGGMRRGAGGGRGGERARGGADAAGGDGGGAEGSGDRRAQRQARIEKAILAVLRPEQRPAYEEWKRNRDGVRTGSLYLVTADGRLERIGVRLGLSDDQATELLRGGIEPGAHVAVRTRKAKGR